MLRPHHFFKVTFCVAAFTVAVVAGCKSPVLRIEVPSGYSGGIEITCDATVSDPRVITADPTGRARVSTCPQHPIDLLIIRDGKQVAPEGPVSWPATGDGIPVGILFSVK